MSASPDLPSFFKLPLELREKIYEEAIRSDDQGCLPANPHPSHLPPICGVSKQILVEAAAVFFRSIELDLQCNLPSLRGLLDRLPANAGWLVVRHLTWTYENSGFFHEPLILLCENVQEITIKFGPHEIFVHFPCLLEYCKCLHGHYRLPSASEAIDILGLGGALLHVPKLKKILLRTRRLTAWESRNVDFFQYMANSDGTATTRQDYIKVLWDVRDRMEDEFRKQDARKVEITIKYDDRRMDPQWDSDEDSD